MSIARHHAEWLSLVPVSGPFLSLPVLMEVFNTGLEPHDPEHVRLLRQEYANWQEAFEKRKSDPAPHHNWIKFVITKTLDLDERILLEGQAVPQSLNVEMPEHHEILRPSMVVVDPATKKPRLLIKTYPRSQDLSSYVAGSPWKASPDTRMTELLHGSGVRLGLVTNGEQWMLVDAPKGETSGYSSWYSTLWLEEPITLRAFRSLLGANRFFNVPDDQTLESLLAKSASDQQEVTDQLGYQVRRAVEVLIYSLDRADQDFGRELLADVSPEQLYESALTVMMRLVFLFCAEERELIPSKPFPVYEQNYSVSTISKQLRELADQHGEELLERRYDAWTRLLAAFRVVYGGLIHDDVHIPAYGGSLFNPDRYPFLEGRKRGSKWEDTEANPLPVNNRTVLHLLEALQLLQIKVPGGGPAEARRLSFRALDIEQIGHVYEGLLDHTAKRATEPYLGLGGTRDKEPETPLAELEQRAAKGESEFIKYLKEETGRSESALKKLFKAELDKQEAARFRTVCQSDDGLWKRIEPLAGLVRTDSFGYPVVIPTGSVFVTAGTDRRSSGTHYTPRSLTEPIVQYTLEPLVYIGPAEGLPKSEWKLKTAKELLALKICDMACGSGAFLVQATRYMAERLLEAWEIAREANPSTPNITPEGLPSSGGLNESLIPDDPAERKLYAMRLIAQRCIYGVDKNPLAVEMAKLSLWLLTMAKDKPFEFLDHNIRCGDSLVGLRSIDQLKHFSLKPDPNDKVLFKGPLDEAIEEAINLRLKLEGMPCNSVEDVKRQEELLAEANEKIARLRCAADLLVSAEFWGENAKDKLQKVQYASLKSVELFEKGDLEEFQALAAKERRGQSMFHWCLEFPEVIVKRGGFDAFVGNPPFMGGKKISGLFGTLYRDFVIYEVANDVIGIADLCAYFILRADDLGSLVVNLGFITTNTIAQGDTREVGLDRLLAKNRLIYRSVSSQKWPGIANLEVSLLWIRKSRWTGQFVLNNQVVRSISAYLDVPGDLAKNPFPLEIQAGKCFQGSNIRGAGFVLSQDEANLLLSASPRNADILFPYLIGDDINSRLDSTPSRWVINFFDWGRERASQYVDAFRIVEQTVLPERLKIKHAATRSQKSEFFWRYDSQAKQLYAAIEKLERVFVAARVSKYVIFVPVKPNIVFSDATVVVADEHYSMFCVLQSDVHLAWVRQYQSSLETRGRYTPTVCYETFPMPVYKGISESVLEETGQMFSDARADSALRRKDGLTIVYNRFHDPDETSPDIQKLRDLHVEMDNAVSAAYGWNDLKLELGFHKVKDDIRFTISETARREVLQRLLKLNHERYAEEDKQGLHGKRKRAAKDTAPNKKATKAKADKPQKPPTQLFDFGDEDE
jgi:hypothetical protein